MIDNPKTKDEERYNDNVYRLRAQSLTNIVTRQFQLVYFGHFNYAELDELAISEFDALYNMLLEQKNEEKKASEEALRKQKEKAKSKPRKHH